MKRSRAWLLVSVLAATFFAMGLRTSPILIPATTCTNQFIRSIAVSTGIGTCATVSLTADVTGTLPIANGGTNDTGTAWTAFTPVPTSSGGSFTTVSSAGAYKTLGKSVWFRIVITITTAGTATGSISLTAPVGTAAGTATFVCRDQVTTGFTGTGIISSGTSQLSNILTYNSLTMIATGVSIACTGTYEQS